MSIRQNCYFNVNFNTLKVTQINYTYKFVFYAAGMEKQSSVMNVIDFDKSLFQGGAGQSEKIDFTAFN